MKNTEYKTLDLSKVEIDFTGAKNAHLEHTSGNFLCLTFHLKDGSMVRIRKSDYGVVVDAPIVPMITKFQVKTTKGLSAMFTSRDEADKLAEEISDAEVTEIHIPKEQTNLLADFLS